MLSREAILGSFQRRFVDVDTPAGKVRIRNLNEREFAELESGNLTKDGELNLAALGAKRRKWLAAVIVDDSGQHMFNQAGDVAKLGNIDAGVASAIFIAARKHCGLDDEGEEKNLTEAAE